MKMDIKSQIAKIDQAIKKHKGLAQWGNVESKERLKELREQKKELIRELKQK